MLVNKCGHLSQKYQLNTLLVSKSYILLIVFFLGLSGAGNANEQPMSETGGVAKEADREIKAFDLELHEIGIFNTDDNEDSRLNPKGMTPEIARQMLQAEQQRITAEIKGQFCDQAPTEQICSVLPNDNLDFSELFVYIFLTQAAQNSFDIFSWQSFIALNWPLDQTLNLPRAGDAKQLLNLNALPRVWSQFSTPQEIFNPDYRDDICGDTGQVQGQGQGQSRDTDNVSAAILNSSIFLQPSGKPVIDRNGNYLLYDVRVNDVMVDYVRSNGLDSMQGQQEFMASAASIEFPLGRYDDKLHKRGGSPGSIAIKTAWKVIDAGSGDDSQRYFTIDGLIPVEAGQSESGQPFCVEAQLGLVGMHIMRRTESGNGGHWIWSTFEHIDNAPLAGNARRPNDIFNEVQFEGGCRAPAKLDRKYALFSEACPDCPTNQLVHNDWKWAASAPFAVKYQGPSGAGSQVVRCWDVFEGTQLINRLWQEKLGGTVWANYFSISAQWKGANRGKTVPEGEVPRFMTNTTMETYEQYKRTGSCLSCHAAARTAAGQPAGFSFLLSLLLRYQPQN